MLKFSASSLSPHALQVRAIELVLFASPLVGAYYYGYTEQSSPLFCPFKALTGIPCPGCGMTRSFIAIATGHLDKALDYHFFGIFLFIGFAIATIHLFLELLSKRKVITPFSKLIKNKQIQLSFLFLFLIYYLIRINNLLKSGEIAYGFYHSSLGKLIF